MLPDLGTIGYLCKNFGSSRLELTVPNVGTKGYTIARNCQFPDVKHTVPFLGPRGYHNHGKELRVPKF